MSEANSAGSAGGAAREPSADRRLATIRSLLSKAEATEFPDEAEAFFSKASELISRWAIDEAMLWDGAEGAGREQPEELQIVVHSPYLLQKSVLVGAVAGAHGCRSVRLTAGPGARSEILSVIGFPSELRWVETLVTSLLLQLTSAMLANCPTGLTASASASWRRSFIVGYAEEVSGRLESHRREAAAARGQQSSAAGGDDRGAGTASGQSVALVLASRAEDVDRDFRRRHPHIRSSWASSGRSAMGRNAGQRAGRDASLTRGSIGARGSLGPG